MRSNACEIMYKLCVRVCVYFKHQNIGRKSTDVPGTVPALPSWALGVWALDVATLEQYRGRGVLAHTSQTVFAKCLKRRSPGKVLKSANYRRNPIQRISIKRSNKELARVYKCTNKMADQAPWRYCTGFFPLNLSKFTPFYKEINHFYCAISQCNSF